MEEHLHCNRCSRVILLKDIQADMDRGVSFSVTYHVIDGARVVAQVSHRTMCPPGAFSLDD